MSLNLGMIVESFMKLYMTVRFFGKTFFAPSWENAPEMGQEFFEFKEKFGH